MRRTAIIVAIGLLSVAAAAPSIGADLPRPGPHYYTKAPVYQPYIPYSWQGFYGGINGGYGFGHSILSNSTGSSSTSPEGGLLGITLGYNFQAGHTVFGLEADSEYSWLRATDGVAAPCPGCEVRNFYMGTFRGRLGYAMNNWLPYITGGGAVGDIQTSTPAGGSQYSYKLGWIVGGGMEYAFPTTNWSAKVEYLYTDLGSATCDAAHCGTAVDTSFHASLIRGGIDYHF